MFVLSLVNLSGETMMSQKAAYVCGPLTELSSAEANHAKGFYCKIADVCQEIMGVRAFVPHEHCDPIVHAGLSPFEVDKIERRQICELTSVVIIVALAPSWGGGIEVEMANSCGIPVIVLHGENKKVSRLLRGNPAVKDIICYFSDQEALDELRITLATRELVRTM
jgi:hypothetical protein